MIGIFSMNHVASVDLGPDNIEKLVLPAFQVLDTDEFVVREIPSSWRALLGRGEPPKYIGDGLHRLLPVHGWKPTEPR